MLLRRFDHERHLRVTGIPATATDLDLFLAFQMAGQVTELRRFDDGVIEVDMATPEDCEAAILLHDWTDWDGHRVRAERIEVNEFCNSLTNHHKVKIKRRYPSLMKEWVKALERRDEVKRCTVYRRATS